MKWFIKRSNILIDNSGYYLVVINRIGVLVEWFDTYIRARDILKTYNQDPIRWTEYFNRYFDGGMNIDEMDLHLYKRLMGRPWTPEEVNRK